MYESYMEGKWNSNVINVSTLIKFLKHTNHPFFVRIFNKDIKDFVRRNFLIVLDTEKNKYESCICMMCLKAYLVGICRTVNIPDCSLSFIFNEFNSPIGHNGYYLDKGELIKVNSVSQNLDEKSKIEEAIECFNS